MVINTPHGKCVQVTPTESILDSNNTLEIGQKDRYGGMVDTVAFRNEF